MRNAIPIDKKIAMTLWFLSTGSEYRTVGHLFGVSKATVRITVNLVCCLISTVMLHDYVTVPSGAALIEVIEGFKKLGFPNALVLLMGHTYQMSILLTTTTEKVGTP